ncbi:MAG: hypothetical protein KDN22_07105 [Verrucomicrobiae bacterium]|nr:hypothetical protein [Verrucomicrobiae bacterium]
MKYSLALYLGYLLTAGAVSAQLIAKPNLSSSSVATVQVSATRTSTMLFPYPIEAVIGNDLTTGSDDNTEAAFQYTHPAGSKLLAVICSRPGAAADCVIMANESLYLIRLVHSESPQVAVTFKEPPAPTVLPQKETVPVRRALPEEDPLDFSPPNLLRIMQHAKSYRLPTSSIPTRQIYTRRRQGKLTSVVTRISRFHADDALVVSGSIINHSILRRIQLNSSGYRLLINGREYPVSMIDCPDSIGRSKSTRFTALLMGDGSKRANLGMPQHVALIIPNQH